MENSNLKINESNTFRKRIIGNPWLIPIGVSFLSVTGIFCIWLFLSDNNIRNAIFCPTVFWGLAYFIYWYFQDSKKVYKVDGNGREFPIIS